MDEKMLTLEAFEEASEVVKEAVYGAINGNAVATANLDLLEINKSSLKGSNGSLKGALNVSNTYDDSIVKDEFNQSLDFDLSVTDKDLKVKVKDNDYNTHEHYKMEAYEKLKFDALFHGSDWKGSDMYNKIVKEFTAIGVDVVFLPHTEGISSTLIREKANKQ